MSSITVIILTMNEEKNIEKCIKSIKDIADRIVIVDSGSDDKTVNLARMMGAEVVHHEFRNYSSQFNWALDNIGITSKWTMRLDADEVIPEALAKEIVNEMGAHETDDVNGMILKLKQCFLGRWLKYGGTYPFEKLMLFKTGTGRIEERNMDEHTILSSGKSITLRNDAEHYDFKSIRHYINKHNWYAAREAMDYVENNVKCSMKDLEEGQLKSRRKQKTLYYKMPKFHRALWLFIFRYIIQGGFLDGKEGLVFHVLEDFWYRFLVDAKIYEYEKKGYLEIETGALK